MISHNSVENVFLLHYYEVMFFMTFDDIIIKIIIITKIKINNSKIC